MKTKDRILESAIALFAEKGFTETTMRDIANQSGIRAPSIYNYFPSKHDILTYIMDLYIQYTAEHIPSRDRWESYVRGHGAREVLNAMFFVFEEENAPQMLGILRIFLQEQFRVPEVNEFMRKRYIDEVKAAFVDVINALREQGKLSMRVNAELYAHIFCSLNMMATLELGFLRPEEQEPPGDGQWMRSVRMLIEQMLSTP